MTAGEWYDPNPDLSQYEQGDIIKDVPYFFFPTRRSETEQPKWQLLRPKKPLPPGMTLDQRMKRLPVDLEANAAKLVEDRWQYPLGEYFVSTARKMTVQIITRSCAIAKDSSTLYLVAPVVPLKDHPPEWRSEESMAAFH